MLCDGSPSTVVDNQTRGWSIKFNPGDPQECTLIPALVLLLSTTMLNPYPLRSRSSSNPPRPYTALLKQKQEKVKRDAAEAQGDPDLPAWLRRIPVRQSHFAVARPSDATGIRVGSDDSPRSPITVSLFSPCPPFSQLVISSRTHHLLVRLISTPPGFSSLPSTGPSFGSFNTLCWHVHLSSR